jgi:predicted metal-dependent phosphoesterase TrpH
MIISADFHSHTIYSKDSLTRPADLIKSAHRRGLQRVVVTDHNSIAGALAARQLDPDLIVAGEEIKTTRGEILAAFVTEEIPGGLSPQDTIKCLRDQGAFISVSHPFDIRSGAWALEDLEQIAPLVDAVEVFNARCIKPEANQLALRFAQEHGLPGTAGSDAHAAFELGAARLDLPEFKTADELRNVIRQAIPRGHLSPFWVHFFSRFARIRKELAV